MNAAMRHLKGASEIMSSQTAEYNDADSRQLQAVAAMPADVVMMKMENDQIFSVAKARPREPAVIVKQLHDLIEAYPAAAAGAIYSKPVGTVTEVTCGKCGIKYQVQKVVADTECVACGSKERKNMRSVKKFAEGLSIRAAETIRSIYGYTRLATTTEILENGNAKLSGTIVDYAAGNITSDERIVSPWYKAAGGGGMQRTPEDRFLNVLVKAEKSKLRRDVILDNTPAIVKTAYRDMCEAKMGLLVTPEEIDQKILPAFGTFGLSAEHLGKIIGKPRSDGWTEADRMQLRKILVALKQEETTVRELLDGVSVAPKAEPTAGATMDDLVGGSKAPTPPPPPSQKPAGVPPPPPPKKPASRESEPPFDPPTEKEIADSEPAPEAQSTDPDADQLLTEWEGVLAEADLRECERLEREELAKVPEALKGRVLEMVLARKATIRGNRGERSNGTASGDAAQLDPMDWTRQQAAKCVTFPDWKSLNAKIDGTKWSDETKAAARAIVEEVKAAKKAK